MPPKSEPPTFSFETVACLVATMEANGMTLGTKHYQTMAANDTSRTVSSFEHQFRVVKKRAKEINAAAPASPKTPVKTPASAARGKKRASKDISSEQKDGEEEDLGETPSKKVKTEEELM